LSQTFVEEVIEVLCLLSQGFAGFGKRLVKWGCVGRWGITEAICKFTCGLGQLCCFLCGLLGLVGRILCGIGIWSGLGHLPLCLLVGGLSGLLSGFCSLLGGLCGFLGSLERCAFGVGCQLCGSFSQLGSLLGCLSGKFCILRGTLCGLIGFFSVVCSLLLGFLSGLLSCLGSLLCGLLSLLCSVLCGL